MCHKQRNASRFRSDGCHRLDRFSFFRYQDSWEGLYQIGWWMMMVTIFPGDG